MTEQLQLDTIYNMDCLEGMKMIPDASVDLVVTDPPYVLETQGAGFFGKKSDEYAKKYKGTKAYTYGGERYVMKEIANISEGFNEAVLDELCRVMKKINIYLWCSQKQIMPYLDYFVTKKGCNWNLLTWHKSNPIPECGNKYVTDTEFCLFFREKGVPLYGDFDTKATYFVTTTNMEDKNQWHHPTIKPLPFFQRHIINSSKEGDTVLDPFMGSGTTAVACVKEGRHFIGFELSPEYHKKAVQRVKNEQAQTRLF